MWPFKSKKTPNESQHSYPPCSHCGGINTSLIVSHGTNNPDYVRIWRGQQSLTYRCSDCGLDFYGEEPRECLVGEVMTSDQLIDDEEALREAEEEIARQVEENGDRRYWRM